MRAKLAAGLLLLSSTLVGVAATPAEAASVCDDGLADTTWVGPATQDGSASWAEPSNWSSGVPTATSSVCIPHTVAGPRVLEGTTASAGVVTLEGTLTVDTSLLVTSVVGELGQLHGPGTTTVTGRLSGYLTFQDAAVVDLRERAALGGELSVFDGSTLNVHGDTVLQPGARIDSLSDNAGLFTIAESGSLTFDTRFASAKVIGGFANHGAVTVTAGHVLMMGADPGDAHPGQFSTGTFTGSTAATFNVANTELRSDALLNHVTWVDHIAVPAGNTVTVAASHMLDWSQLDTAPSIHGEGELVLTDGTVFEARFGGSLTVTVPAGEVVTMGYSSVRDQARLQVYGELLQEDGLFLENDARLDVHGVHRVVQGTAVHSRGADPGLAIIHAGGQLLTDEGAGLLVFTPFVNRGTVDSGSGFLHVAPEVESPASSSGTFRAGAAGSLLLGYPYEDGPQFALDQAIVEGEVDVYGRVHANALQVRGHLSTGPGGATWPPGQLELAGTTTLGDGASVSGNVTVSGALEADPGATGTATLSGAEVTGEIRALSGTLSVPSLASTTLATDGTLTKGGWFAFPGATLDLPSVTTNDALLQLVGPGASFGDGLANLTGIGPNGTLLLGGDDLAVPGRLRNEGVLSLAPGSRLDVGGKFRQLATGRLMTWLTSAGRGTVRAAGTRELAGNLWIERDPAYEPPVGTVLNFITSNGRVDAGDSFDRVRSPRYGTQKLRVAYATNHVRLRVDRVG